jgi:hypothetical protein
LIQTNDEATASEVSSQGRDLRRRTDINDDETDEPSTHKQDSVPLAAQSSTTSNLGSTPKRGSTLEHEENLRNWLTKNNVTLGGRFELIKRLNSLGQTVLELKSLKDDNIYTPTSKLALQLLGEEYGTDFRLQVVYSAENKSAFFA